MLEKILKERERGLFWRSENSRDVADDWTGHERWVNFPLVLIHTTTLLTHFASSTDDANSSTSNTETRLFPTSKGAQNEDHFLHKFHQTHSPFLSTWLQLFLATMSSVCTSGFILHSNCGTSFNCSRYVTYTGGGGIWFAREKSIYKGRNGNEFSHRKWNDDNEGGTFISKMTITPNVSSKRQRHKRKYEFFQYA